MKKKFIVLTLALSVMFSNQAVAYAVSDIGAVAETDAEFQKEETFSFDEEFDWDIDEILVIYALDNDPFLLEAKERGIKIVYQENIVLPRYVYFSSLTWITRDGVVSLSCNPIHPWTIPLDESWREAVRYFQYHPMYTDINNSSKYNSMYNQYKCHVQFANGIKTPWNIEPAKPDKSYSDWVLSACN